MPQKGILFMFVFEMTLILGHCAVYKTITYSELNYPFISPIAVAV